MTPGEAQALQEHVTEVERLVGVAYHGMEQEQRREMTAETFASTLNNPPLQRHLLAVETPMLEAAVRVGGEYLQIRPSTSGPVIRKLERQTV